MALHDFAVPAMGERAGLRLPGSVVAVYGGPLVLALGLGGLVIAVLGASLPAGWAAGGRTAVALRGQ
ncbi:hypothetical protein AB8O53_35210 [Streptomyces pilosus]